VAFRALRRRADVNALVSLVGTVNLQDTLARILDADLIEDLLASRPLPFSHEALGYEIDIRFIHDAVEHGFHSLESTRADVAACNFPVVHIHAGADAWTQLADVEYVFQVSPGGVLRDTYVLPNASHKLEHNPAAARVALRQAIVVLKQHLTGEHLQPHDVECPAFIDIVSKHRQERVLERVGYRSAELAVSHSAT
jgi:pimeloyl-ACP methyl ester carboxylesterase